MKFLKMLIFKAIPYTKTDRRKKQQKSKKERDSNNAQYSQRAVRDVIKRATIYSQYRVQYFFEKSLIWCEFIYPH